MADKLDFFSKGTEAWFKHPEEGFVAAAMTEKKVDKTSVQLVFRNNSGADDLTSLSYLHEAALLHSVRLRYSQESIYTYSGLFAIAEEAYRKMVVERRNQSIIVSGESGAGKTMSAKFVMRYFAIVEELTGGTKSSHPKQGQDEGGSIEDAVLGTNPIMEAFGNAKTTRNDNSSRFGKYIEILFDRRPKNPSSVFISGARVRTYLLERSRLTFQPESERNYHIFYQLCAAVPAAEKKELGIISWDKFHYLKQGNTGTIHGVDDVAEFEITKKGMSTVGISVSEQWSIFKICAAILHIGNIKITASGGTAQIDDADEALLFASKLLDVDASKFKHWLIKRQIITRSEKIVTNASPDQAVVARDSIAKFIYSKLFDWIVKVVNIKLDTSNGSVDQSFIGVLDIYGFEHFAKNSFEQFCINYANEKLQAEFARHVFKLEQEEYVAEAISWSFINFSDNQKCIDMIENKLGILDLLDEESRLPSGADKSLITKLYQRFGPAEHEYFQKPRFGETEFVVKHYALDVAYQIDGFIEKNKDTVSDEQLAMLNSSGFELFQEIIKIDAPEAVSPPRGGRGGAKKPTLGSIFKQSLIQLMETLRQTNPHYIRCIKPNQSKRPFEFEPQNVLGQLLACGVLETIKISRAGYPSKHTYAEFVSRFYFLVHSSIWKRNAKELTEAIVKSSIKGDNKYELGKTKIFFRAGQLAFLEKLRKEKYDAIVHLLQKNALRKYHQSRYKAMKAATLVIQRSWRRHFQTKEDRQLLKELKEEFARARLEKGTADQETIGVYVEEVAVDDYPETTELVDQPLADALREAEEAQANLAREAERLEELVRLKDEEFRLQQELESAKALKQMALSEEETKELRRYLLDTAKGLAAIEKGSKRLQASRELQKMIRQRDAHVKALQKELDSCKQELATARDQLKNAPKKDDADVTTLKQELSSLRELMTQLFANQMHPDKAR
ncbi:Myosin type-2 heavy chain 1 [Kappamyces sp. JEL0680]|nr:Myosin type-2 heavy chain 1 [Kappamyces sp. JEL0680]